MISGTNACGGGTKTVRSAAVGRPAPAFTVSNVRESQPDVSLGQFAGKPLVINFWASWCVPCRREMPAFESVYRRRAGKVAFLGVDRQDARDDALRFLDRTGVTYPSGYDPDGKLDAPYRLRGMPTTVVVAANGTVVDHVSGPMSEDRLERVLERAATPAPSR